MEMDYVGIISKLLICIFEAYIFYNFFKNIFEYRSSKKSLHILVLALMVITMWSVNCMNNSLLNVCTVPLLFFSCNCLIYKTSLKSRVIYVIVFFLVMIGMELLFEIIFSVICGVQHVEIMNNPYNWTFIIMTEKMVSLVVLKAIKYFLNQTGNYMDKKLYRWVYVLPVTSIIILIGFFYSDIYLGIISIPKVILLLGCFLLLFSNALVFYIFERASLLMYQTSQLEIHDMESKHYERIEEVNQEHRKFIHDLQHYLRTISSLSQQGNTDEINEVPESVKLTD